MSRVRISKRANQELEDIAAYIGQHNAAAAAREVAKLRQRFRLLASQPLMGERCDDLRPGLRCFSSGSYVIFFRPIASGVEILDVVHGARDIPQFFRDLTDD